jgi:hypothetical protein
MIDNHPFFTIYNDFLMKKKKSLEEYTFHFSKYIYIPNSIDDKRKHFIIKGNEFTKERIESEIASLDKGEELAFHSTIEINRKTYHFPFIDFSISINDWNFDRDFIRLKRTIPKAHEIILFNSGRSLHGYSLKLLTQKEWIDFMGRLLLVDLANTSYKIIDSRWIGHRLMGRYSSLRWSNNSGKYLTEPFRIINL